MTSASSAASIGEQRVLLGDPVAVAGYRREEILGLAVADGAHAEPPAMRAGADPGIIAVAPVSEVVAAFVAGAGMVADLVGRQARG